MHPVAFEGDRRISSGKLAKMGLEFTKSALVERKGFTSFSGSWDWSARKLSDLNKAGASGSSGNRIFAEFLERFFLTKGGVCTLG